MRKHYRRLPNLRNLTILAYRKKLLIFSLDASVIMPKDLKFFASLGLFSFYLRKTPNRLTYRIAPFYYNLKPFWFWLKIISSYTRRVYITIESLKKLDLRLGSSFLICHNQNDIVTHKYLISRNVGGEALFFII